MGPFSLILRAGGRALIPVALALSTGFNPAGAQQPGPVEAAPLAAPPVAQPGIPAPAQAPAPPPATLPPAPLPTPPGAEPAPPLAQPQAQPPAPPSAAAPPIAAGRPTLLPNAGDPSDVDDVVLPAKPAAILAGRSTWDEGFQQITEAFKRIEAALAKGGLTPAGRPIAVFLETDDAGFRFEAMVPLSSAPASPPAGLADIRFGTTPGGRALRFVHEGPYDDIDSTYETITAYLDAKTITVGDTFIEEYVTDPQDATDPDLRINIFVTPR